MRGMDDTTPRVLPLRDAAAHVGISEKALRRRVERGSLASLRVDGRMAVRVADLYAAGLRPVGDTTVDTGYATPRGTSAHQATRGDHGGDSSAIVVLVAQIAEQAETIGRMRVLTERAESTERELVAEREARLRLEASYVEERARAEAAEAHARQLEEQLAAAVTVTDPVADPPRRRRFWER